MVNRTIKKYLNPIFFYLLLTLIVGGCYERIDKKQNTIRGIGGNEKQGIQKNLTNCCATIGFDNYTRYLPNGVQFDILTQIVALWSFNNNEITFVAAADPEQKDIAIRFASPDSVIFSPKIVGNSWVPVSVESLGKFTQKEDGSFILFLNASHQWSRSQFSRVLIYYLGAVYGLPNSSNPQSAMYPFMNDLPASYIDLRSSILVDSLYNNTACDNWKELGKLPFTVSKKGDFDIFTVHNNAYIIEGKTDMWKFSPREMPQWKALLPVPFAGRSFTVFGIDGHAYAIVSGGGWWQYDPISDLWLFGGTSELLADALSSAVYNSKGYMVLISKEGNSNFLNVWEFNPIDKTMKALTKYEVSPTANLENTLVGTHSRGLFFILNQESEVVGLELEKQEWKLYQPFPGFKLADKAAVLFRTKNQNFLVTETNKQWIYASDWAVRSNPTISGQEVVMAFGLSCKGYIGTNKGQFWEYSP